MKRVIPFLIAIASTTLLASCSSLPRGAQSLAEDDLREAVIRERLKPASPAMVFLDLNGDPSDEFIMRLGAYSFPIKKLSQCSTKNPKGIPTDLETGVQGVVLRLTSIKPITGGQVQVNGGMTYINGEKGTDTFIMEKKSGKWQLVHFTFAAKTLPAVRCIDLKPPIRSPD